MAGDRNEWRSTLSFSGLKEADDDDNDLKGSSSAAASTTRQRKMIDADRF